MGYEKNTAKLSQSHLAESRRLNFGFGLKPLVYTNLLMQTSKIHFATIYVLMYKTLGSAFTFTYLHDTQHEKDQHRNPLQKIPIILNFGSAARGEIISSAPLRKYFPRNGRADGKKMFRLRARVYTRVSIATDHLTAGQTEDTDKCDRDRFHHHRRRPLLRRQWRLGRRIS